MIEEMFKWLHGRIGFFAFIVLAIPIPPLAYFHSFLQSTGIAFSLVDVTPYDLIIGASNAHIYAFDCALQSAKELPSTIPTISITSLMIYVSCVFCRSKKRNPFSCAWEDFKSIMMALMFIATLCAFIIAITIYRQFGEEEATRIRTPNDNQSESFVLKSGKSISAGSSIKIGSSRIIQVSQGNQNKITIIKEDDISQVIIEVSERNILSDPYKPLE